MKLMLIASLVALLSACSERVEVPIKPADSPVARKITIHGEDPVAFYNALRFKAEGDCKKSVLYQYLVASSIPTGIDQNIFATLELMLFGDLYVAHFLEYIPRKYAFEKPMVIRERILEGTYSVKDGSLMMNGLGSALGVMQFGTRALILNVEDDSRSFPKKLLALKKVYSKDPPMERFRICK